MSGKKDKTDKDTMTDQIVVELDRRGRGTVIHNLLMDGPGSEALHQQTVPLDTFLRVLALQYVAHAQQVFGLTPQGMTLRGAYQNGGVTVFLIEVAPGTRTIRWLRDDSPSPFGREATYRDVTIALPYQYFFVAVAHNGSLCKKNSVYFANQPIKSLHDELADCLYYNCSPNSYGVHCWICTQHVDLGLKSVSPTPLDVASTFVEWFFASSFNRSSEYNEGASFWSKYREYPHDSRVATIQAWEVASQENPDFVTQISWHGSGLSAQHVFQELASGNTGPQNLRDLVTLVRTCK